MADETPKKAIRRVRNAETFRERAIKAAEISDQPGRADRLKNAGGKLTNPLLKPIGQTASNVARLKAFRWLRKPLRLIGKLIFPVYLRNSWRELRQVTWPSWKESRRLTYAVLIFAIIFGAAIALVDYGLDTVFKHILLK